MKRAEHIAAFVEVLWDWYARHKRSLPWRDLTIEDDAQRAYRILVSEVMLQQTQVPRVEIVYKRFVREFPSLEALSKASNREIIIAWRGMGYNSRALRLRDAAKIIVQTFNGEFPKKMEELQSINGIGHYTAAAIRNFAFNLPTPCLDTNIRRIFHRAFVGAENRDGTWKKDDKYLLKLAGEVLDVALTYDLSSHSFKKQSEGVGLAGSAPGGHRRGKGWFVEGKPSGLPSTPANWHAALMDFGSLVCTKNNPKWEICPLAKRGLMKAAYKVKVAKRKAAKSEPGREIAGKFIPNRIIRGRIIEELRDAHAGLPLADIGGRVCIDWNEADHREWLRGILEKLKKDALVRSSGKKFLLTD